MREPTARLECEDAAKRKALGGTAPRAFADLRCRRSNTSSLRVGQRGINATGERIDVVAERLVGAVHDHRDGRQDERVFRHRLATGIANYRLAGADEHFRHCFHNISLFIAFLGTVKAIFFVSSCLDMYLHLKTLLDASICRLMTLKESAHNRPCHHKALDIDS